MDETPFSLRFSLLGPVRAWRDGAELSLGSPQQRAVLAMLLLRRGRPVTVEEIVDGVWGWAPPRSSVAVVRTYVTRLRRLLEPRRAPGTASRLLESVADGYALRVPVHAVDLPVVERLVEEARELRGEGRHGAAGDLLTAALSSWDGEALAGIPGPYAERQRTRLNELWLATTETRLEVDIEHGRHASVIGELYELAAAQPLRERPHELLMRALYQSGRQADALAVFAAARRLLDEELGVDPGPGLRAVHERILRADPALAAPAQAPNPAHTPMLVPAQLPAVLADYPGACALSGRSAPRRPARDVGQPGQSRRGARRVPARTGRAGPRCPRQSRRAGGAVPHDHGRAADPGAARRRVRRRAGAGHRHAAPGRADHRLPARRSSTLDSQAAGRQAR